jgi:tRNA threonylcarbamoyladenosine biosynthesis protein TsaB
VIVLALDVTSEFGSIAVRRGGETAAEIRLHSSEGFAHLIFSAIEQALAQASISLAQVDCFAGASGPGAFTGVRVGLSAVKGLAEAMGKPAAGISNLRALSTFGRSANRAVILDARRGDVFAAVYNANLELVGSEVVTKLPSWLESLPPAEYEFISHGRFSIDAALAETGIAGMPIVKAPEYLSEAVALCAERDAAQGSLSDPAALDANYVRRSDAELFWKEP